MVILLNYTVLSECGLWPRRTKQNSSRRWKRCETGLSRIARGSRCRIRQDILDSSSSFTMIKMSDLNPLQNDKSPSPSPPVMAASVQIHRSSSPGSSAAKSQVIAEMWWSLIFGQNGRYGFSSSSIMMMIAAFTNS